MKVADPDDAARRDRLGCPPCAPPLPSPTRPASAPARRDRWHPRPAAPHCRESRATRPMRSPRSPTRIPAGRCCTTRRLTAAIDHPHNGIRVDSYVPALYPHRGPPPVVLPAGTERRDPSPYGYRTMIEDRFHHGQVRGPHRRDPKPRIPRDEAAKFRSSQSRLRQRGISQSEPDSSPRRRPEGCFACLRHGLSHNSPHAPLAMRSQGLSSVTEQDQGPRPT